MIVRAISKDTVNHSVILRGLPTQAGYIPSECFKPNQGLEAWDTPEPTLE